MLYGPILRKIFTGCGIRFAVGDLVQNSTQPLPIMFSVSSAAKLFASKETKCTDFFTAIQARHGFVAN